MRRVSQTSVECAIVGLAALAVLVWWTLEAGGYFERDWIVGTLLLVLVGSSSVVALRGRVAPPSRAAAVALAAFAAYVAWSFLSVLWAQAPADALEGSRRALAYLVWLTLFTLLPWTPRAALAALLAFVAAMTAIGAGTVAGLAGGGDLAGRFIDGSLLGPLGYHNASAAMFAMAAVAALALAARPAPTARMRPFLLAAAMALLGLAALGQSRGLLLTMPLVGLAALLAAPDRPRLALVVAPVAAGLAVLAPAVLAIGRAGSGRAQAEAEPQLRAALDALLGRLGIVTAAVFVVALALPALERRLARGPRLGTWSGRRLAVALAGVALLCAGTGALVATGGQPLDGVRTAWAQFTDVDSGVATQTGLGSGRSDFWRVALEVWREHPIAGAGQDNFADSYTTLRRTEEEPRWVHSLPLRLLAHTGLVGAALFGAFLVATAAGVVRAWRRARSPGTQAVAGAAVLPAVVWLAHGSVDWLWEVPALSAVALALAGIALALGRATDPPDRPTGPRAGESSGGSSRSPRAQRAVAAGALVAAGVTAAVLLPAFVADRDIALAERSWPADPPGAYARLDRAVALEPLSPEPWLTEGRIALRRGDTARAGAALAEAAQRAPRAWYPRFLQGLAASAAGDAERARRALAAAHARNPRDTLVLDALRRAGGPRPVSFTEAQRRLDARRRIQRTQGG